MSQLIASKGYPVQEYTVQTADGYLLGVQRIPHGISNANSTAYEHTADLPLDWSGSNVFSVLRT